MGRDEGNFMGNVWKRILRKERKMGRLGEGVKGRMGYKTDPLLGGAWGGFFDF